MFSGVKQYLLLLQGRVQHRLLFQANVPSIVMCLQIRTPTSRDIQITWIATLDIFQDTKINIEHGCVHLK